MKLNVYDIKGDIVKQDERYIVKDNKTLETLVVSSTELHPDQSTTGHSHAGQEEVYYFLKGFGEMELDDKKINVFVGDVVLIPDGVFHKVHAGRGGLYFVCIFNGKRKTR